MTTPTKVLGSKWLDRPAAASFTRMVKKGLPKAITSAGRTHAEQARLRALYLAGKGNFALPPGDSMHERGLAMDLPAAGIAWMVRNGAKHGWHRTNPKEPWHWEYVRTNDQYRPNLKVGSRGWEVKELQRKIGATADGIFGLGTRAKVKAYQSKHHLVNDGVVGLGTRKALGM